MCVCVCVYIYDGHATALLNSRHSINDYDYPTEFSPGPLIYFLGLSLMPSPPHPIQMSIFEVGPHLAFRIFRSVVPMEPEAQCTSS